jgi:purine-nucleoside phosphorylase
MVPDRVLYPYQRATEAAEALRERFGIGGIDLAVVLGSGWSASADALGETLGGCALAELPHFAAPTVAGHGGELRLVRTRARRLAAVFTGRTHFYETRDAGAVVHGVRTAAAAGARTLVLTNGCGGLNPAWAPGTPVLIRDHINLTGATPIAGANFVDMSYTYTPALRALARQVEPALDDGVYVQFAGPQYETPAEVRMAAVLGGELVGMSTALEAIAAREAGLDILGISLVTNLAAGIGDAPLHHAEVIAAGQTAAPRLAALLSAIVERL